MAGISHLTHAAIKTHNQFLRFNVADTVDGVVDRMECPDVRIPGYAQVVRDTIVSLLDYSDDVAELRSRADYNGK